MQELIFDRLLDERMDGIHKISKEIDSNNLTYYFQGPNITPINFIRFKKKRNVLIKKIEKEQINFGGK